MHSQMYADRQALRRAILTDPDAPYWEGKAGDAWAQVVDRMGQDEAEAWLDTVATDQDSWKRLTELCTRKLVSMDTPPHEAAMNRIDRQLQTHPGIS